MFLDLRPHHIMLLKKVIHQVLHLLVQRDLVHLRAVVLKLGNSGKVLKVFAEVQALHLR